MTGVVIIDAIRTPIGALGGILASVRPDDMAALVIKEIVQRNRLDPALVEEVFFGCANQAGEDNRNVARMAALLAGLPVEVAGVTVNRLCASGLNAINQAARAIKIGEGDVYIAGGVESMSRAPYSLPKAEAGYSFGNLTAYDTALGWRYPNPIMKEMYGTDSMAQTAEHVAAVQKGSIVYLAHPLGRLYYEHGARLHREFFLRALGLTGVTPNQTLMVGDSLTSDIRGAAAVGMRGVLLDRNGRADPADPALAGVRVIRSLREIPTTWE